MTEDRMPWYVWLVLAGALAMSAPGEYDLAVVAGWAATVAWGMPVVVSVYGAVAAYIARKVPKRTPEHRSAVTGALAALALALAFQVTAHLMAAGYVHESPWLVAAVSATPPVVVAHLMHMPRAAAKAARRSAAVTRTEPVAVTAAAASDLPAEATSRPERVAEESAPVADVAVMAARPVAATVPTGHPVVAVAAVNGRPAGVTGRPGTAAGVPSPRSSGEAAGTAMAGDGEPDTLPGLALVTAGGQTADRGRRRPLGRGRAVPDVATIRAAKTTLEGQGLAVTGKTMGEHFGVAERTGRRYLEMTA
ncbi:hypothetical protein [Streptomyces sp. NPDC037389]|uniref:hypothetical protein n=1 Tax=Streptomyces sp. NPDC037389 TaxID=3155369 RepID=UPI0033C8BB5F